MPPGRWPRCLSIALALLYPQALVPIGAALILYVGIVWWQDRQLPLRLLRWLLAVILPADPDCRLLRDHGALQPGDGDLEQPERDRLRRRCRSCCIGFGIPLLVALPGIYRAMRRFERDGDRLMLLWLACIVIAHLSAAQCAAAFHGRHDDPDRLFCHARD